MTVQPKPLLVSSKLISAILPKGVSLGLIRKLREDKGIVSASMSFARGTGRMPGLPDLGAIEREKEVLIVIVDTKRSDEIFGFIYHEAGIGKPHGSIMYMHRLVHASVYTLPDISEEK